jgi:hypothetical protein
LVEELLQISEKRLAGDTPVLAPRDEVKDPRREATALKEVVYVFRAMHPAFGKSMLACAAP